MPPPPPALAPAPKRQSPPSPLLRGGGWPCGRGRSSERDGENGLYGYNGHLYGGAVGGTFIFSPAFRAGLAMAYGRDRTNADALGARNEADAWQAEVFVDGRLTSRWGARLDLSHTWFDTTLDHDTPAGDYRADYASRVFALGGETGYDFRPGDGSTRLTPFAGLRWQRLSQDRIAEKARAGVPAAFATRFDAVEAESLVSSFGMEIAHEIHLPNGRSLIPSLRMAWSHELGDTRIGGTGGYGDLPGTYRVMSLEKSRNAFDIGASLAARVHESAAGSVDLTAGVDASFGRRRTDYGFRLGVGVAF